MAGGGEDWEKLAFGPYPVTEVANVMIPMRDGIKVALKLWLPTDNLDVEPFKVPNGQETSRLIYPGQEVVRERTDFGTILEYIPYCKDYTTLERDHARHTWWTSHGFAACHADIRGSGASEGFYFDEYTQQEFDDGADIIAWICAQKWSNARVGLYGKSWGGFNGLQIAAEQPVGLVTAISLYSTDDRFTDDVHYMGGAVVGTGMVSWANTMFLFNNRAPPPQYFKNLQDWEAHWKRRLEVAGASWLPIWLKHQVRPDPYWAHGSVNEDITRIKIPILAVGGLADGYTNAPLRMADTLNKESKCLIGPWSHGWPDVTIPGPRIDFCGECLRWWNAHLTTPEAKPNPARDACLRLPRLRLFVRDPYTPTQFVDEVPGRWVSVPKWPRRSADYRSIVEAEGEGHEDTPFVHTLYFGPDNTLVDEPISGGEQLPLKPHKLQGINGGNWLAMGNGIDLPEDQTIPNSHSLSFTTAPLEEDLILSGFSTALLSLKAEKPGRYSVAVRLSHLDSAGVALRITYGVLNLAQWKGNEEPEKVFPGGEVITVPIELCVAGCRIPKGDRLVVSISPSYAPTMYPATDLEGLTMETETSCLVLQRLPESAFKNQPVFDKPRPLLSLPKDILAKGEKENSYKENADGSVTFRLLEDTGKKKFPHLGLTMWSREEDLVTVSEDLKKTHSVSKRMCLYTYDEPKVAFAVTAISDMKTEGHGDFMVEERLEAKVDDRVIFDRTWNNRVPRDWV